MKGARARHIIAIGGGGFSSDMRNLRIERYIARLCKKRRPKVCFVPTASGDATTYIERFTRAFERIGCRTSHLSLFQPPRGDLGAYLAGHDAIYVGGGNTHNLVLLWKTWKLDAALRAAYERGIVLAGVSAGALCWFQSGITDSFGPDYRAMRALGWLRGSFCPHFDSEPQRAPLYRKLIRNGALPPGYAVDDGVALHFVDGRLAEAIAAKRGAGARYLRRRGGRLEISPLEPKLLPA